jgi:hypothetical protein
MNTKKENDLTPENGTIEDPKEDLEIIPEGEDVELEDKDVIPSEDDDEGEDDGAEDDLEEDPTPEPEPTPEPPKKEAPAVDFKKKFGDSTRRNQIVESQLKELQKVIGDITQQEIPTDEEMRITDPDWEYRSDFEKNMAVKTVVLERRQNKIFTTLGNITKETEDSSKLVQYIESEPKLKGKEDDFYEFATKPSNKGASMEVLLGAFLYEVKDEEIPSDPNPDPKPKETPPRLSRATPTGGNPPLKKNVAYTPEEIKHIRLTDHKRYNKLVREGKI